MLREHIEETVANALNAAGQGCALASLLDQEGSETFKDVAIAVRNLAGCVEKLAGIIEIISRDS